MRTQVEQRFSNYYETWFSQLEAYRAELVEAGDSDDDCMHVHTKLVSKLTSHIKEYYSTKWAMAKDDVLAFFSPVWLNPLEIAHLWVTGWKPSMLFSVVKKLKDTLSEEQVKKIEELKVKVKVEEDKVEREMERQQVTLADKHMVELARTAIQTSNTNASVSAAMIDGKVRLALKGLLFNLERVMKISDCVRLKALKGMLDELNPKQCVEFLAAEAAVHIQLRQWDMKKQITEKDTARLAEVVSAAHAQP